MHSISSGDVFILYSALCLGSHVEDQNQNKQKCVKIFQKQFKVYQS